MNAMRTTLSLALLGGILNVIAKPLLDQQGLTFGLMLSSVYEPL